MNSWFRSVLYYGIPVAVLLAAGLVLNSGPLVIRWLGAGQQIEATLDQVSRGALAERWSEADRGAEAAQQVWERVRRYLILSSSVEEIEEFDMGLAELTGAVEARDLTQVRIAHRRARVLWHDLTS